MISFLPNLDFLQFAGLFTLGLLTLCVWRRYLHPISDVPGPLTAGLTRVWHISHILKGDQNLMLVRMHDKYGHFVRIAPNEVSVSHPEGIRKILAQPLHKSAWYEVITFPDSRFQNPLSATDPAIKMELSRHLAPAYTLSNLLRSEKSINQVCELLFEWLDKYSASGEAIDLGQYFIYAACDIIGEILFSKQFGFIREGRDIGNAIAYSHPAAIYISIAGYFKWFHVLFLSNPVMTWIGVTPWGHLRETALASIEERQSNPDARFDALAQWFRMLKENPDRMDEHEIQSGAFNAIAAGSEPTASTLQAFIYYMIRLPGAWERARAEVDAAGIEGMPSYADTLKLLYLQTCIKEAMRLFNPSSMGLPRVVPKGGLTIGDRTFPAGTDVSVSIWVMHHSKEIWGTDAREFNPERWFRDDAHTLDKYFIPFGLGYASCPGHYITKIAVSKICAILVRDYDFRQVDPTQEWKWKANFTIIPVDWPCYVKRREKK